MGYPVISHGSKIGMHAILNGQVIPLVRQAKARGVVWPMVKGVDNGGIAIDVKAISPGTLIITRFVSEEYDSAQGVHSWDRETMVARSYGVLNAVKGRLNAAELAAADWIEPINEADPEGVEGWRRFGLYCVELVRAARVLGLKLALPAFNAGTPEYNEMQAFLESGVAGEMKQGGDIFTLHEGVFGNDQAVQLGFGDTIPGAPLIPDGGSLCFRYRYFYSLLAARGEVVPLVISEFYTGGGYPPHQSAADIVKRLEWYDRGIRLDSFVLAVLPFTIDPTGGWTQQDYTPIYNDVLDYLAMEAGVPNDVRPLDPRPVYPPGTSHLVGNCLAVNVREFPYTSVAIPTIQRTLPVGSPVRVYGVYRTPSMSQGWAAVSPHSNEWIRSDFLVRLGGELQW